LTNAEIFWSPHDQDEIRKMVLTREQSPTAIVYTSPRLLCTGPSPCGR
jgi:hypothetical protein